MVATQSRRPSNISAQRRRSQRRSADKLSVHRQQRRSIQQDIRRPSQPSTISNVPRLSIANRFMSPNYLSSSPPSISSASQRRPTTDSCLSFGSQQDTLSVHHERSPSASLSGRTLLSPVPTATSSSTTTAAVDPDPGRLTIASAFMRSTTSLNPPESTSSSSTHRASSSILDELDLGNHSGFALSDQIHPLEGIHRASRTSTLLDTPLLSIDLSLSPHTSTLEGRRIIQPWESQETLVQPKKQAYAASDTEEATTTTIDMKMSEDGYYDSTLGDSVSDCSTRQGDEENSPNANKRPRSWTGAGDGNDVEARGCWIGCCFVSCGQRPSRRALEKRRENQMKKKSCQRGWVFCTFISLILVVVTSYMLWPRTPLMRIEGAELTTPAKVTETRQGVMVGNVQFESAWLVNVTVDNRQNHVPTHLVGVQVLAKDALTGLLIGKGDKTDATVLPPNAISTIQLPVFVDYQAREASDTTFVNLRKTCTPQRQQTVSHNGTTIVQQPPRESLQLHFWITLHIFGLDWFGYKPTVIATPATGGFACPVA